MGNAPDIRPYSQRIRRGGQHDAIMLRWLSRWLGRRAPQALAASSGFIDRASEAMGKGDAAAAVAIYSEALLSAPSAELYYGRANAHNRLGQLDPAIADYSSAVALDAQLAKAYCNRGTVFAAKGEFALAIADYDRALAVNPNDHFAHYNRAHALKLAQQDADALRSYECAIELKPDYVEAHVNRGHLLQEMKQHANAVLSYSAAIDLSSSIAEAFLGRGLAYFKIDDLRAALPDLEQALALRPDYLEALINRGHVLTGLRRPVEAAESYSRALSLKSDQPYLIGLRRHAMMQTCDWRGLPEDLALIRSGLEDGARVCSPMPVLAMLDCPRLQLQAAETWVADVCPPDDSLGQVRRVDAHAKLRIGYFSADFRDHAVAVLTAALFECHDRSSVELIAFAFGPEAKDSTRQRLVRAFDRFVVVREHSDAQIAALARELEIDVAVDLGGYTTHCRTGIFAHRAAPIQVGYLGYMGTMGAPYFDYLIADKGLIPPDERPYYSEKIIYLPSYQVNDIRRESVVKSFSRAELGLPASGFVFCCFNSNYKILPATFESWMRILQRVPGATMYLYVDESIAKKNLMMAAAERGIEPSRLVFGERIRMPEYLARYSCMDLFLDTAPYNAGTTATDALWMGLPVLTLQGHSMAGRMASSLLAAIGIPELIATTTQAYEDLAVELASKSELYSEVRRRLLEYGRQSPLFNARLTAQHLESAFREAYGRYLEGRAPTDIRISHETN